MTQRMTPNGFTLIELLTVMAIIGILAAAALPVYAVIQKNTALGNTVDEIAATVQQAKTNALTAQDGMSWGVTLDTAAHTYSLYRTDGTATLTVKTNTVDAAILIPNTTVEFERLSGDTTATTLVISGYDRQEQISIPTVGSISH